MQIEIKNPMLGALVGALIANANTNEYNWTVAEKIAKHFPGGEAAFKEFNITSARSKLYDQIARQLKKEKVNLYAGTAFWCAPNKIAGHDIAYRSDGITIHGDFVSLETMEQMVKECKNV